MNTNKGAFMKRENKKALTPSREENRMRVVKQLEKCIAGLRDELDGKRKEIENLNLKVEALNNRIDQMQKAAS